MNAILIIHTIIAVLAAITIYTFIGLIPGTDETSVLMPITLAVVLAGTPPIITLSFFIAAIISLNISNTIPTALVGLPGGVMSSPMLEYSLYLKEEGRSALVIKKMAAGSLIGVIISIPFSLLLANILAPYGEKLQLLSSLLFFYGAIFLALAGKNKILSLISILPLAILFMGLRYLYWETGVVARATNITASFFLGITAGPLILSLLKLLNREEGQYMKRETMKSISIPMEAIEEGTLNPLKILSKSEIQKSIVASFLANFLFVLSPVGITVLLGEMLTNGIENPIKKSYASITIMSALIQSTYISGIVIPLVAIGIPLSPAAIGPGSPLFNASPVYTVDNNLHHRLDRWEFTVGILIAAIIAIMIGYYISNKFAIPISIFVLKRVPHEGILSLFISLIILLAYMDGGLINILGVLLIAIICGTLNEMGMGYGVQFMTLYAAPWIVEKMALF